MFVDKEILLQNWKIRLCGYTLVSLTKIIYLCMFVGKLSTWTDDRTREVVVHDFCFWWDLPKDWECQFIITRQQRAHQAQFFRQHMVHLKEYVSVHLLFILDPFSNTSNISDHMMGSLVKNELGRIWEKSDNGLSWGTILTCASTNS